MKLGKLVVANLLCLSMMSATAQNYNNNTQAEESTSENTGKLLQSVINWAALVGYDISQEKTPPLAYVELTSYANASLLETLLYSTFFGSIPTTTPPVIKSGSSSSEGAGLPFVPQSESTTAINAASNLTFKNFNSGSQQSSGQVVSIQANSLVDQQPYQADPVSQQIFNILGTPDVSYCSATAQNNPQQNVSNGTNPNGKSASPCSIAPTMFQSQLIENVVGPVPTPTSFYSIASNAQILPQLNSNSLIAPLNYSPDALNFPSSTADGATQPGLVATNQAELAANFIRYASGSVLPTILPNQYAYQTVYNAAIDNTNAAQFQMQAIISTYLTSLRVYAAQSSVGIGNLYYILSRRLPQEQKGGSSTSTGSGSSGQQSASAPSQALNEYNMATWRIFQVGGAPSTGAAGSTSSSGKTATQWIEKINSASPTTVQKEIAILLAEINYQLYLDRQIQERMLMTSSVSLLQGTKATQPNSDLSNQLTAASANLAQ